MSHYVNEIPFNIIVGLPFSPLLLPFIVTTCPDIWRSLTLNSRYASPVKKKGNAEESEACVDRASTFLKEDLPKKAISPLEKKIIWISKVGKKTLLIKVIHNPSLPKIIEPVSIQTLLDPDPHPLSRNYIVFPRYPRTTTTTPLSRERRLVQACYQRLWRLEHPQPRASSPSYNLLVNFASLLEGYVRWDKKYLERERERETRLFQLRKGLPGPLLPLRSCYRHSLSLCATSIADSTYLEPSSSISSNGTERERDPLGCVGG